MCRPGRLIFLRCEYKLALVVVEPVSRCLARVDCFVRDLDEISLVDFLAHELILGKTKVEGAG